MQLATSTSQRGKRSAATRQRLLDAAAFVLANKGYASTRLVDVAAVAEIQTGSLYYHFSLREHLVSEVLAVARKSTSDKVIAHVAGLPSDCGPLARLGAALAAHIDAVLTSRDYSTAMLRLIGQLPVELENDARKARRAYATFWRQLFEDAQSTEMLRTDIDLTAALHLTLSGLDTLPGWFHIDEAPGHLDAAELAVQLESLLLHGMATELGLRRWRQDLSRIVPSDHIPSRPRRPRHSEKLDSKATLTRKRILDAAAAEFRSHGYAGARLADIAAAADLQTGSLYYHFDSRIDIVAELVRQSWKRSQDALNYALSRLPSDAAPITRVAAVIDAHVRSVTAGSYTPGVMAIIGQLPDSVRELDDPLQRAYQRTWHTMLEDAVAAGELRTDLDTSVLQRYIVGALNQSYEWYDEKQNTAIDHLAQQTQSLYLEGLGPTPPALLP